MIMLHLCRTVYRFWVGEERKSGCEADGRGLPYYLCSTDKEK